MGQKELLLTLGAIALFSMISFRINQATVRNSEAIYAQQAEFFALSLAQRFVEEAKTKAFDEFTIAGNPATIPGGFTGSPGSGGGEDYPDFDDVDDFNGYTTTVDTKMGMMSVTVVVSYVQDTNLDTAVSPWTFYKKMTVTVRSDYLLQPVRAEYVFAFQKNT
jgi:hypothetical protein